MSQKKVVKSCSERVLGAGKQGQPEIADYVLVYRNRRLAVLEARRRDSN